MSANSASERRGWRGTRTGSSFLPLLPLFSAGRSLLSLFSVPLPLCSVLLSCAVPDTDTLKAPEVAAARAAFEAHLQAIHERDLEAYLDGYLDSPDFVYLGPEGVSRGFAAFAAAWRAGRAFPDSLAAGDPEVTWLAPGVVHVAYPFAARQGEVTGTGWSERVLVRTPDGWKFAVTSVIPVVRGDEGR